MPENALKFDWIDIPAKRRMMAEALQFQLAQTAAFPRPQLARLQLANLSALMDHALKHVPYYQRGEYAPVKDWSDWARLPVLTRRQLQRNEQALRADIDLSGREGRTYKKRSSGSTGRPVAVLTTERAQRYWRALTLRDHLWQQRDFSQAYATIRYFDRGEAMPPGLSQPSWGSSVRSMFQTGPGLGLSSSAPLDAQYQWLRRSRPGYLHTYPSVLRALAEMNLASKEPISLLGMATFGENLEPDTRSFVQQSFGGRLSDMYSCQELGYIALQCPRYDHYHVQAEVCLVEVLDDDNQACAPGTLGRVVVTHLHNYAMPLIRYDIGDYAIAGDARDCDCGIRLPILERVVGRSRNLVTYPDGTRNWPSYNPMKLMEILPNAQFQLVQKRVDSLLLRIGTDRQPTEETLREIKDTITEAMGHPFDIQVEILPQIPRSKNGKYEEFQSDVERV